MRRGLRVRAHTVRVRGGVRTDAPRSGPQDKHAALLAFPRGHVETWRWNPQNEDLERVADADERERLVFAVRNNSFDRELGQYPEEPNEGWPRVSYLITSATLERMGLSGGVTTSSSAEQTAFDRCGAPKCHQNQSPPAASIFADRPALFLAFTLLAYSRNRFNHLCTTATTCTTLL